MLKDLVPQQLDQTGMRIVAHNGRKPFHGAIHDARHATMDIAEIDFRPSDRKTDDKPRLLEEAALICVLVNLPRHGGSRRASFGHDGVRRHRPRPNVTKQPRFTLLLLRRDPDAVGAE